jgi:hypothetical protein
LKRAASGRGVVVEGELARDERCSSVDVGSGGTTNPCVCNIFAKSMESSRSAVWPLLPSWLDEETTIDQKRSD